MHVHYSNTIINILRLFETHMLTCYRPTTSMEQSGCGVFRSPSARAWPRTRETVEMYCSLVKTLSSSLVGKFVWQKKSDRGKLYGAVQCIGFRISYMYRRVFFFDHFFPHKFSDQTFWDPEQERDAPSQNQYLEKPVPNSKCSQRYQKVI
jgi:hypothetical protein